MVGELSHIMKSRSAWIGGGRGGVRRGREGREARKVQVIMPSLLVQVSAELGGQGRVGTGGRTSA